MKSIANSLQRDRFVSYKGIVASITCLIFLITPSCEKFVTINSEITSEYLLSDDLVVYLESTQTFRYKGKPGVTTIPIGNQDLSKFEDCFVLHVSSGANSATAVSSAIIKLDGQEVLNTSDFSKNRGQFTFEICNLTEQSVITVEVRGQPGSYIDIWIEGSLKTSITPAFEQIGPICQNSTPPSLPESSTNTPEITGAWDPETINTAIVGTTTYTFTPDAGQNATTTSIEIVVMGPTFPLFEQIGPIYQNSAHPELPETSENGITGTWDPETISTSAVGEFSFTFTPAEGQCASVVTMDIEIICQLTDIDGNCYKILTIGTQTWMAENLKTTKYNDGSDIPLVEDNSVWSTLTTPGYCWYNNNEAEHIDTYGALYNGFTINTGKLCPTGWHVPTDDEWTTLENYLIENGFNYDGSTSGNKIAKALAAGSGWWESPDVVGAVGNDLSKNNSSGFSALPGGIRFNTGGFTMKEHSGYWWSSSEYYDVSWHLYIRFNLANSTRHLYSRNYGISVRCIKDND